jgi:CheY-like chemotaxis protein
MDGYELARRLRAAARGRPLVLLSASGAGVSEAAARGAGFDATYAKPVEPQVIVDLLHHLLEQSFAVQSAAGREA